MNCGDSSEATCVAVREVLNRVGDKWSVQAVVLLRDGPKRFSELRREIEGVSQRMLALTLRGLERDGLVTRKVEATTPPRVDYELTRMGRTLLDPVAALQDWAKAHGGAMLKARQKYDARQRGAGIRRDV